MLKVLLVQPVHASLKSLEEIFSEKNFVSRAVKRITFPLGLMEIGSVLEKNNINVKIVDLDRYLFYFIIRPILYAQINIINFIPINLLKRLQGG